MSRLIEAGGGLFNLLTRLVYVPFAVVSWTFLILQSWKSIIGLFAVGLVFYGVSNYGGTLVSTIVNTMQFEITPIYQNQVKPILQGIIQTFINPLFCWYNGFLIFPYSVGRNGIFPILRNGGLLSTARAAAMFFTQFAKDFFLNYFANGRFLSQEFDYSGVFAKWQIFINNWQSLWCYGCNDLCPIYTMTPNQIVSNQLKDPNWGDFWGKSFNGGMVAVQQVIYVVRQVLFPTQPTVPYLNFSRTFTLWCESGTGLRISFENIMQEFWDAFIPYNFVWKDFFCFFDSLNCLILKQIEFVLNLIIHADSVLTHFRNTDSTYWNNNVKLDFTVILNYFGSADYFDTIVMNQTNITSYQLSTRDQGTPGGLPNPLYNKTTVGQCFCIALNRLLCDPQANGTTCAQQYNGTLVAGIDPCCLSNNAGSLMANNMAFMFEFTLHFKTVSDFIQFTDKQPFTTAIKFGVTNTVNCIWMIFRVVSIYGFCIERIFSELTNFIVCTGELVFRITVALLTTPYWNTFLPGQCNFITCPNSAPLNMGLEFLNRIADPNIPDGLINCFCFTLNTGFNVPFAGCGNLTCEPTGFIPPTNMSRRFSERDFVNQRINYREMYQKSLYEIMFPEGRYINLLRNNQRVDRNLNISKYKRASGTFLQTFNSLDRKFEQFSTDIGKCGRELRHGTCKFNQKRTLISLNITEQQVNCTNLTTTIPPCFGLCCFPVKFIQLLAHTVAFGARAINGAFQTRNGQSSDYWSGRACMNNMPCLSSDITMLVIDLIAPVDCICQFIKLLLPPQGFGDPCCAFIVLGELISCVIQILINIANSIAGDPDFLYIKGNATTLDDPQIITDFDVVLRLTLDLFDCVCNFVRTIFAVAFSGSSLEKAFDPCCLARVYVRAILEILRLLFRVVISLSTLDQVESECYMYVNGFGNARPSCQYAIEDLPIVIQFKKISSVLLAPPVSPELKYECSATTNLNMNSPDLEGAPTCICRILNAVLAMVNKVDSNFTGDLNAQPRCLVNLCCPIYAGGESIKTVVDFAAQLAATFWQNWEFKRILVVPNSVIPESFFIPQETLNFFFCDEYGTAGCNDPLCLQSNPSFYPGYMPLTNNHPIGTNYSGFPGIINSLTQYNISEQNIRKLKCGKIEPALTALKDLLGGCLCASGNFTNIIQGRGTCGIKNLNANGPANVFDSLLRWFIAFVTEKSNLFPIRITWPSCFCCGGPNPDDPGMIRPFADLIVIILRQSIGLIRNLGNPSYFTSAGGTLTDNQFNVASLTNNFDDLRKTWINRFLAPVADALCRFLTNCGCLLSMILGDTCESTKYNAISSLIRYIGELVIRIANVVEAVIKMFAQEPPGQCVGKGLEGNANRPGDQGSIGKTGTIVPTCSPAGGLAPVFNGVTSNKLGSIIVASATFYVDMLIGISRFACSTVCPGLVSGDVDINLISSQTCSCWNDSPYVGITGQAGQVCGFDLCNCVYNSGRPSDIGVISQYIFRCPNNTETCTKREILRAAMINNNDFGATTDPNKITGCDGRYNTVFDSRCVYYQNRDPVCNVFGPPINFGSGSTLGILLQINQNDLPCDGGCDRRLSGFETINLKNPLITWGTVYPGYKFKPVSVGNTIDGTSIICQILNLPPMKKANVKKDVVMVTCVDPALCPPIVTTSNPTSVIPTSTVDTFIPPQSSSVNTISFYENLRKLGRNLIISAPGVVPVVYASEDLQPACTRDYCITRGLCKNDQMVPCSPGTRILDGIVIAILKYFDCLIQQLFSGGLVGNVVNFVFELVLKILSFIWQLSGGLIRFGVALGMFTFNLGVNLWLAPGDLFKTFVVDTVNLFQTFGAIFTQPIADGYKRQSRREPEPKYDNFQDKFKITRNVFYKSINLRAEYVKKFYIKEYDIRSDSPVLWPLLHLDSYHYKYQVGYYTHLYENIDYSFNNLIGTYNDTKLDLIDAFYHLKSESVILLSPIFDTIQEKIQNLPKIETPQLFRVIYDGSLKAHFKKYLPDFYIPTVRYNPPRFENITFLPTNYKYNATIEKNGDIAKRMLYSISHYFFPEYTTKTHHERFIVGGDCRIVDAVINEGTRISDYCLNEFKENVPGAREILGKRIGNSKHFQKFKGRISYVGNSWKRAKIDYIPLEKRVEPLHRDTYARAHGHRNLIFNIINSIGSFDFQQWIANFITDVIYWFKNPNLDDSFYPDVGFRYWVQFSIICKFPENLDCSIGIGFGNAIWEVGKYYLPIFIGLSLLFPGFSSVLGIFFNLLIYFFLVLAVGWHYSPACIALFPTSNLGGTAWTIPVLPIPLNIFPALPMCMWDELLEALDAVFSTCYTWIPQSLMNNQQCVGPVDIPNCSEVGISGPLESITYWGYRIFGSIWCDIMVGITSVFGFLGDASVTCNAIKTASNTQMDRQLRCGIESVGTIAWVILGGYIIGTFIVVVVLALVNVLHALLLLLPFVPFYNNAIGVFNRTDNVNGELVVDEEDKVRIISKKQPGMVDYIAKGIKKTFLRYKKGDKVE